MYVWLIVGFFCLIKGADYFVDGASSVARLLKVPPIIIGLTIVAMGTSAPETAVSISSAIKNANALSISNVIGSNFFNLLVVTGICAAIKPVCMTKDLMKRDFPISIAITFLLLFLLGMSFLGGGSTIALSRMNGIVLLIVFVAYLLLLIKNTLAQRARGEYEEEEIETYSGLKSIMLIIIGGVGISLGGQLVVKSATAIATTLGLTETLIGLTVVALGTSLPELVTSIVASRKGQNDLALGNVVGSNIFNILLVLGISSTVSPIVLTDMNVLVDLGILIVINLITFALAMRGRKLNRVDGIIMLVMYVAYMGYMIPRELTGFLAI
jgi:cation:H+ antiporter